MLRPRVASALRTRLAPNTGVHRKQLADGIGRSQETIRQWLDEQSSIKAEDLYETAKFLKDPTLISEIYGDLSGPSPRILWFTHDGTELPAHAGLAEAARRHLKLPIHTPGDTAAYVMRNLGWVGIEKQADKTITLSYDDRGIVLASAKAACDWLLSRAAEVEGVTRSVRVSGRLLERQERDAEVAALTLMRAAEIASTPRRLPWRVERLHPESVPEIAPIAKAHREAPQRVVEAVARLGLMPSCSLLRVSGTDVENLEVGSSVDIPGKTEFVGRHVLDRADMAYGELVRDHMLQACEEPTVHWLRGSIFGTPVSYIRGAFYSGPESGVVVSSPVLRPSEEALSDATVFG